MVDELGVDLKEFYQFEAPAVSTGTVVDAKSTFQEVRSTPVTPAINPGLSKVLTPEEHGHKGIQVQPTALDDIVRIGADVKMAEPPPAGSAISELFGMGCEALSAQIRPVCEAVNPAPEQAIELKVKPLELHAPGVT